MGDYRDRMIRAYQFRRSGQILYADQEATRLVQCNFVQRKKANDPAKVVSINHNKPTLTLKR